MELGEESGKGITWVYLETFCAYAANFLKLIFTFKSVFPIDIWHISVSFTKTEKEGQSTLALIIPRHLYTSAFHIPAFHATTNRVGKAGLQV